MVDNNLITSTHILSQSDGNIVSDMDGEKVMLSIQNGKYYNLGELGGVIWDLISTPTSFEQLINSLMAQYDVERTICEQQVKTFLTQLIDEGLIHLKVS